MSLEDEGLCTPRCRVVIHFVCVWWVTAMLWGFLFGLPFVDLKPVIGFDKSVFRCTSLIFDALHIGHRPTPSTIELPRHTLDGTVLGPHFAWFFSITAFACLIAIWKRPPVLRLLALMAFALTLSWLLAVMFVLGVIVVIEAQGSGITQPVAHSLMLIGIGLAAVVSLLGGDAACSFLSPQEVAAVGRRSDRLLAGATICGSAILIALIVHGGTRSQKALRGDYRTRVQRALATHNAPAALVYSRRLVDLEPGSEEIQFLAAKALVRNGQIELGFEKIEELADVQEGNFSPARVWLADHLVREQKHLTDPSQMKRLIRLLQDEIGQPHGRDDHTVLAALAELYVATKQWESARELLDDDATTRVPELRLTFARLLILNGEPERARQFIGQAKEYYVSQRHDNSDSCELALKIAECDLMLEDFESSTSRLREEWQRTRKEVLRAALARHLVAWYDVLSREAPEDDKGRLELLERALKHCAGNKAAVARLAVLAAEEGAAGGPAAQALAAHVNRGQQPAALHLIIGSTAYGRGDLTTAVQHLEQAYRLEPRRPEVLNNLAWYLAESNPQHLPRALELTDRLVQLAPGELQYRETRGQILLRLGFWDRAITNLELALQAMPRYAPIHVALAKAYEQVGDAEMARLHRERADQLTASTLPSKQSAQPDL